MIFSREVDGSTTRALIASNGEVILGISPTHQEEPLEGLKEAFLTPKDTETPNPPENPAESPTGL